jgi:endonuclease G
LAALGQAASATGESCRRPTSAAFASGRRGEPLASFTRTPFWRDTNLLSNTTPQESELNQGPWARLESAERALARSESVLAVYVMTGPLYERSMPALPRADEPHRVPSGYWKIVATHENSAVKVAAFHFDQETARTADFCAHLTTVTIIESKTGFHFFHGLSATDQLNIETNPGGLAADLGC